MTSDAKNVGVGTNGVFFFGGGGECSEDFAILHSTQLYIISLYNKSLLSKVGGNQNMSPNVRSLGSMAPLPPRYSDITDSVSGLVALVGRLVGVS